MNNILLERALKGVSTEDFKKTSFCVTGKTIDLPWINLRLLCVTWISCRRLLGENNDRNQFSYASG